MANHPFLRGVSFVDLEQRRLTPPYMPAVSGIADASNFENLDDEYFGSDDDDESFNRMPDDEMLAAVQDARLFDW